MTVSPLGYDGDVPDATPCDYLDFNLDTSRYSLPVTTDGGSTGDVTPTGDSYLLWEHWGGNWVDAEKTPSDTEDDLHCWAAATSNVLAWTGWGLVGGMTNTDQMFQYFQDHWTDQGGLMEFGWDWWFDGTNDSQGWSGWAQEDVQGGAFYPCLDAYDYIHQTSSESGAMAAIDQYLHAGYGTTIGIYGPGGHAITVWGYNHAAGDSDNYLGLWITDSDDTKYIDNAPDRLRYYEVEYSGGQWFLQDYYGSNDWYIGCVQALEQKNPGEPTPVDPVNTIGGIVFNDLNANGTQQQGESGWANKSVFLDQNLNGVRDTQTATWTSTDVGKGIADLSTTSSTLDVSGLTAPIADVNITLNITHSYDWDLEIYLVSAEGTRVLLCGNVGSWGDNFTNTTFDDQATVSISAGSAPFSGSFRPQGSLADFFAESANGTWTLEITDMYSGDQGVLNSWSVQITTGETCVTTDAAGHYAFGDLDDGSYRVQLVTPDGWDRTSPLSGYRDITVAGGQTVSSANFGLRQFPITDLGAVDFLLQEDVALTAGSHWFSCQTTHTGYLTLEALLADTTGVSVTLYDSYLRQVVASSTNAEGQRLDYSVTSGQTYYFRVDVAAGGETADLRATNLVRRSGTSVTVYGTADVDEFAFVSTSTKHNVAINGVDYRFTRSLVTTISFAGGGNDSASLTGSTSAETFTFTASKTTFAGYRITVNATGVHDVAIRGGGGTDTARLYDSSGNDSYTATPAHAELILASGVIVGVDDCDVVNAYASTGVDTATLYDSAGADTFSGRNTESYLQGSGFRNYVKGFDHLNVRFEAGGTDASTLYDTTGTDTFTGSADQVGVNMAWGMDIQLYGSESTAIRAGAGGLDVVNLVGTAGADRFTGSATSSLLTLSTGATISVRACKNVNVDLSDGGADTAALTGTSGNDVLTSNSTSTSLAMYGGARITLASCRTVSVNMWSGTGDTAYLYDSTGDDAFNSSPTRSVMQWAGGASATVRYCEVVRAFASEGNDTAVLNDSAGYDSFLDRASDAVLRGSGFFDAVAGFDLVTANLTAGGSDTATILDTAGDDAFTASASQAARTSAAGTSFTVNGAETTTLRASLGGNDSFNLLGTSSADTLTARMTGTSLVMANRVRIDVFTTASISVDMAGGADTANLYDSTGNDAVVVTPDSAEMQWSNGATIAVANVETVRVYASSGTDTATLHDSAGADTFAGKYNESYVRGVGFFSYVKGFDVVAVHFDAGGNDASSLYDTTRTDTFDGAADQVSMTASTGARVTVFGSEWTTIRSGSGGSDVVNLVGTEGDDQFTGGPTSSLLTFSTGQTIRVLSCLNVNVDLAAGGNDTAVLTGTSGNDLLRSYSNSTMLALRGGARITVASCKTVAVNASGGYDRAYLYDSALDDYLEADGRWAKLTYGGGANVTLNNVAWLQAVSNAGGSETKRIASVDFVFQIEGVWADV